MSTGSLLTVTAFQGPSIDAQASLQVIGAVPQGSLRDNISLGGGPQGFIGDWVGQGPLMLGLDVAFLGYGHATDQVPFSSTVGPQVPVEVSTSNNVLATACWGCTCQPGFSAGAAGSARTPRD